MLFLLALAWSCLVAWLLFRATRQFQAYEVLAPENDLWPEPPPTVTAIVPARNEFHTIGACLQGLLGQLYPVDRLRIVVVDDNSTDGTAAIVRSQMESKPHCRLIEAGGLPKGWVGKTHACWQAASLAQSDWLCFMDADTVAAPELLTTAVAFAEKRGIDFLSLEPFQELGSFWERVIIPAGLLLISFQTDLRTINDPATPDAAADGQFILMRREVYEAVGGHAAVREKISEDKALAVLSKQAGFRTYIMGGADLIRVRMYTGLRNLWQGLSKNAVDIVESTRVALFAAVGGLLLGWAAPLLPLWAWLNFAGTGMSSSGAWPLGLALLGSLALFITHIAEARYFRIPLWYGLLFPVGATMAAGILLHSLWKQMTGQIAWKDRVCPPQ